MPSGRFNSRLFEEESPLIETDMTSTVPSQQLRAKKRFPEKSLPGVLSATNMMRLKLLECAPDSSRRSLYYGHIERGSNHFQTYVDTSRLFNDAERSGCEQTRVTQWLTKELEKTGGAIEKNRLVVIFAPENVSNSQFAQTVNNIFYGGCANIISIPPTIKYRSNFEAENLRLKNAIGLLCKNLGAADAPIEFCYVDDNIISGATYHRANSLIRELLPNGLKIQPIVFNRIFVLVNRLSSGNKATYVANPERNFHSFLDIAISSMRTVGDSCVCCKLHSNYQALFFMSCTERMANYFAGKVFDTRLRRFDEDGLSDDETRGVSDKGSLCSPFERLLMAHLVNAYFVPLANAADRDGDYAVCIDAMLGIIDPKADFLAFSGEGRVIADILDTMTWRARATAFLKTVSRPFASFDKSFRKASLKLIIRLANAFLFGERPAGADRVLDGVVAETEKYKVDFVVDVLLEATVDLNSSYLLNLEVLLAATQIIEAAGSPTDVYIKLAALYKRVVVTSSDETRSVILCDVLDRADLAVDRAEDGDPLKNKNVRLFLSLLRLENSLIIVRPPNVEWRAAVRGDYPIVNIIRRSLDLPGGSRLDEAKCLDSLHHLRRQATEIDKSSDSSPEYADNGSPGASNDGSGSPYSPLLEGFSKAISAFTGGGNSLITLWAGVNPKEDGGGVGARESDLVIVEHCSKGLYSRSVKDQDIYFLKSREEVRRALDSESEWGLRGVYLEEGSPEPFIVIKFDNSGLNSLKHRLRDFKHNSLYRTSELFHRACTSSLPVYLHIKLEGNSGNEGGWTDKHLILISQMVLMHRNRLSRAFETYFATSALPDAQVHRNALARISQQRAIAHQSPEETSKLEPIISTLIKSGDEELKKSAIRLLTFSINLFIGQLYTLKTWSNIGNVGHASSPLMFRGGCPGRYGLHNVCRALISDTEPWSPLSNESGIPSFVFDYFELYVNGCKINGPSGKAHLEEFIFRDDILQCGFPIFAIIARAFMDIYENGKRENGKVRVDISREDGWLVVKNEDGKTPHGGEAGIDGHNVLLDARISDIVNFPLNKEPQDETHDRKSSGLSLTAIAWAIGRALGEPPQKVVCAKYCLCEGKRFYELKLKILAH